MAVWCEPLSRMMSKVHTTDEKKYLVLTLLVAKYDPELATLKQDVRTKCESKDTVGLQL